MSQNLIDVLKNSNLVSVPEIENASIYLQNRELESMRNVLLTSTNGLEKAEKSLDELYEMVSYVQNEEKAEKYIKQLLKERKKVQEIMQARNINPAKLAYILKTQKDLAFFADITYTDKKQPLRIVKLRDIDAETTFSRVGTMLVPKLEDGNLKLASNNNHYFITYTWVQEKQYQNFFLALEKVIESDFRAGVTDEEKQAYKQALHELNALLVNASNAILYGKKAQGLEFLQTADDLLSIFVGAKFPKAEKSSPVQPMPSIEDVKGAVEKNTDCGEEVEQYIDHILCLAYDSNPDMQHNGDRNGLVIKSKTPLKGYIVRRKKDGTEDTEEITL